MCSQGTGVCRYLYSSLKNCHYLIDQMTLVSNSKVSIDLILQTCAGLPATLPSCAGEKLVAVKTLTRNCNRENLRGEYFHLPQ